MSEQAPNLGAKFKCFKCECKFYDLGAPEPLCPRCGADQREDPTPDPREAYASRGRKSPRRRPKKKMPAPVPTIDKGLEAEEDLLDDDFAKDKDPADAKKADAKKTDKE